MKHLHNRGRYPETLDVFQRIMKEKWKKFRDFNRACNQQVRDSNSSGGSIIYIYNERQNL